MITKIIGQKLLTLDITDSTNNYINNLCRQKNVVNGLVVVAHQQTGGRGQRNNVWHSQAKKNLTCSIYIEPQNLPAEKQFIISKITCLAITALLGQYKIEAKIKWPNDIYVNGKKIAGILIENTVRSGMLSNSIVGIGLNVNQTQFEGLPLATSMQQVAGHGFDLSEILENLLLQFENLFFDVETDAIHGQYVVNMLHIGMQRKYRDANGEFAGTIIGVDRYGRLLICDGEENERCYAFNEVAFCQLTS